MPSYRLQTRSNHRSVPLRRSRLLSPIVRAALRERVGASWSELTAANKARVHVRRIGFTDSTYENGRLLLDPFLLFNGRLTDRPFTVNRFCSVVAGTGTVKARTAVEPVERLAASCARDSSNFERILEYSERGGESPVSLTCARACARARVSHL